MSKDIHKRITLKGIDAELELLKERVKKLEEKDASDVRDDAREVPDKVQEKLNGIEEIVKSYDKKIDDLERELFRSGLHKEASGNSSNGKCPATYFTRVPVAEW